LETKESSSRDSRSSMVTVVAGDLNFFSAASILVEARLATLPYEPGRLSLGTSRHFQRLPNLASGFGNPKIIAIFDNYKTTIIKKF